MISDVWEAGDYLCNAVVREVTRPSVDGIGRISQHIKQAANQKSFRESYEAEQAAIQELRDQFLRFQLEEERRSLETAHNQHRIDKREKHLFMSIATSGSLTELSSHLPPFLSHLSRTLGTTGTYLAEMRQREGEDVLAYFAASRGQEFLIGQVLSRSQGVAWRVLEEGEGEGGGEEEGEAAPDALALAQRTEALDRSDKDVPILRVFHALDLPSLHFFRLSRPGEFFALPVVFSGPPSPPLVKHLTASITAAMDARLKFESDIIDEERAKEEAKEAARRAAEAAATTGKGKKGAAKAKAAPIPEPPKEEEKDEKGPEKIFDFFADAAVFPPPMDGSPQCKWVFCGDTCGDQPRFREPLATSPTDTATAWNRRLVEEGHTGALLDVDSDRQLTDSQVCKVRSAGRWLMEHTGRAALASAMRTARITALMQRGTLPDILAATQQEMEARVSAVRPAAVVAPKAAPKAKAKGKAAKKGKEEPPPTAELTPEQEQEIREIQLQSHRTTLEQTVKSLLLAYRPGEQVGFPASCAHLFEGLFTLAGLPLAVYAASVDATGLVSDSVDWRRVEELWSDDVLKGILTFAVDRVDRPLSLTRIKEKLGDIKAEELDEVYLPWGVLGRWLAAVAECRPYYTAKAKDTLAELSDVRLLTVDVTYFEEEAEAEEQEGQAKEGAEAEAAAEEGEEGEEEEECEAEQEAEKGEAEEEEPTEKPFKPLTQGHIDLFVDRAFTAVSDGGRLGSVMLPLEEAVIDPPPQPNTTTLLWCPLEQGDIFTPYEGGDEIMKELIADKGCHLFVLGDEQGNAINALNRTFEWNLVGAPLPAPAPPGSGQPAAAGCHVTAETVLQYPLAALGGGEGGLVEAELQTKAALPNPHIYPVVSRRCSAHLVDPTSLPADASAPLTLKALDCAVVREGRGEVWLISFDPETAPESVQSLLASILTATVLNKRPVKGKLRGAADPQDWLVGGKEGMRHLKKLVNYMTFPKGKNPNSVMEHPPPANYNEEDDAEEEQEGEQEEPDADAEAETEHEQEEGQEGQEGDTSPSKKKQAAPPPEPSLKEKLHNGLVHLWTFDERKDRKKEGVEVPLPVAGEAAEGEDEEGAAVVPKEPKDFYWTSWTSAAEAIWRGLDDPPVAPPGLFGGAIRLTGPSHHMTITDLLPRPFPPHDTLEMEDLSLEGIGGGWTIALWFRPAVKTTESEQRLLIVRGVGEADKGLAPLNGCEVCVNGQERLVFRSGKNVGVAPEKEEEPPEEEEKEGEAEGEADKEGDEGGADEQEVEAKEEAAEEEVEAEAEQEEEVVVDPLTDIIADEDRELIEGTSLDYVMFMEWNCLVITQKGPYRYLYLNGRYQSSCRHYMGPSAISTWHQGDPLPQEEGSEHPPGPSIQSPLPTGLTLGCQAVEGWNVAFKGDVCQLAIWDRPLPTKESRDLFIASHVRSILLPPLSPPRPPIVTLLHANPLLRLSAAQSLVALLQELTLPLGSPLESSADMEVQVEFHPFDEPSARTLVESATADVDMLVLPPLERSACVVPKREEVFAWRRQGFEGKAFLGDEELDILRGYVRRGGRLVVFTDPYKYALELLGHLFESFKLPSAHATFEPPRPPPASPLSLAPLQFASRLILPPPLQDFFHTHTCPPLFPRSEWTAPAAFSPFDLPETAIPVYGMEGVGAFSVKQAEGKVTYFAFGQEVGREVAVMEKRAGEGKEGEADPVPKGGWREVMWGIMKGPQVMDY